MKLLCFLAVLLALGSPADARSISFSIGGHRLHIDSSRHCRSISCASKAISRRLDWRRNRFDGDRDLAVPPAKPAPSVPQTVSPPAPPAITAPAKTIVAAEPPVTYTAAASTTRVLTVPPPAPPASRPATPPVEQASIPEAPPPPVAKPVETVPPAPQVERVAHRAEGEPQDSPIGDWQTEGKGTVRIAKCGKALCGYVLTSSSELGEAILINMKPQTERQWTGNVFSQDSGTTYYGTIAMKGINTLRVEACALGRFYCSGNNWSRITRHAGSLVSVALRA